MTQEAQLPGTRALRQPLPYAVLLLVTSVVYFVAGKLSLTLAIPPGYATAVWPPSGIALAAALLFGARIWPAIWIGAALVNVTVDSSLLAAVVIASGNTLEALVGQALIRRHVGDPARFQRGEDVLKFVALCAAASTIAASVALLPLMAGNALSWEENFRNWWTWWQGDLSGMIVVAPLILSWSVRDGERWPPEKKWEAAVFGALLVLAAALLTSGNASELAPLSLTFVTLPFILWGALRFGPREVSTAIAVICAVAVWYTLRHHESATTGAMNERLLLLLTFNAMVVATGLVLATVVSERARAAEVLRRRGELLESIAHYDPLTDLPNATLFRNQRDSAKMSERAAAQFSLEDKLRRAIERNEFVLFYQPKVDVHSRSVAGLEALLRWRNPELGLIQPLQFIPLLEETGLIVEVGRWALKQAVRDQSAWAAEGVRVPRIAVNVSSIQLRHAGFVDDVQQAVELASGPPAIDLEITESHIMENIAPAMAKLARLRALGVGIAIDDFGTGYSSLAYLARLPADVLKIDRSFIARMLQDDHAMTLVQTILSLATSLGLKTVAEGVELEEQADMLGLLGCNEMQGYLISTPLPRQEMTPLLQRSA